MKFGMMHGWRESYLERDIGVSISLVDNGDIVIRDRDDQGREKPFLCRDTDDMIFALLDIVKRKICDKRDCE